MKLSELAAKAAALPERPAFDWPGPEHFHDTVFKDACFNEDGTPNVDGLIEYTDKLRKRMAEFSSGLSKMCDAYDKLRAVVLAAEVDL